MVWTTTFDAVFFVTIGTIVAGLIKHMIDVGYKSKCEHCSCLCISIDRRVDIEAQTDVVQMETPVPPAAQTTSEGVMST
jgi:hypothetical protein